MLHDVVERTKIFKHGADAAYTEDGETFYPLPGESVVSMNFWGFTPKMLAELWTRFPDFYAKEVPAKPAEMRVLSAVRRQCAAASRDGPRARTAVQRGLVRRDLSRGSCLRAGRDRADEGRGPLSGGSLGQIKRSERRAPAS